jgi:hypothetical protein
MSHLEDIQLSYLQHLQYALGYSFISFKASLIFMFHGLFPDCCIYTGSTMIKQLNERLTIQKDNHK